MDARPVAEREDGDAIMEISNEHIKTIQQALQINRALITMSAAQDEHKGAQVVAINAALAALDISQRKWGKCYCGCDACKYCEQLLEPTP